MKRQWLLLTMLMALSPAYAEGDAQKILNCMRANTPVNLRVQDVQLTTTNRMGETQELKGKLYATREASASGGPGLLRAMLKLEAPTQLMGVSYLVRETDDYLRDGMFVYLPSVRRVRRVTGTFADGALMGTDFSYFEFKQIANAFGDMTAQPPVEVDLDGRKTHQLTFKPVEGAETRYSTVKAWIDQKTCLPLRAEFMEGKKMRKEMTIPAASLQQSGQIWYPTEINIRDLKDSSNTQLKVNRVVIEEKISKRYFDPNAFHLMN